MLFKQATIFSLTTTLPVIERIIQEAAFRECSGLEASSAGFSTPRDRLPDTIITAGPDLALIAIREDRKLLPASVVKTATKRRVAEIEDREARKVGRKEKREIQEAVRDELLGRAFTGTSIACALIDLKRNRLIIDSTSNGKTDLFTEHLNKGAKGKEELELARLPIAADVPLTITQWVAAGEAPDGFTVDDRALLEDTEGGKIRVTNSSIDTDEVRALITAGKSCSELAMTYNDEISFVLTPDFRFKRVALIDTKKEAAGEDEMEVLQSEMIITADAIDRLLSALTAAMPVAAAA